MRYSVEYNYNCCRHFIVDADSEEDAIRLAEEEDSRMTRQERQEDMDIELVEIQSGEEPE